MEMNTQFKRTAIAITLAAFIWTGTAWSASTAFAATNSFSDVRGHWAEKHMAKLAMQDIIRGNEGKFRPNDSMRREDAVIVALKFMGLADDVSLTGSITFPASFQVDNYAKSYIMEAFKQKILLPEEEYALANQEKGKSWGSTNATREWVARLLVRAIGKEADAAANAGKATAFSDNAKMDAKLRAYVLTAVQEGLVSGVTATTFEPKSPITRASIATLFSKAESKVSVAYSGQVSGTLLSIDNGKLSMLLDNGSIYDYPITASTMIGRYDSEKPVSASALKLYGKAIVIQDAAGAAGYVEQMDDNAYITTIDGTFSKLSAASSTVWLSVDDGFKDYKYDPKYEPAVTDAQGKKIALADIPANALITLKVDKVRVEPKIVAISVKQSVVNKTGSGTVSGWNSATGTLEVTDAATGTKETLSVPQQATFKREDTYVLRDDLKVGEVITYEVRSSLVVSVQMAKPSQTTVTGTFDSYVKESNSILFTVNGKLSAEYLAPNNSVKISGLPDATLDDLQKGDALGLSLDSSGKVSIINVTNRTIQTLAGAMVEAYIPKMKTLFVTDGAGKGHTFYLGGNVRYDMNGNKMDSVSATAMFTPGKKIMITSSGSNESGKIAVSVFFIAKYTGTLLENNTTAKTIKVQIDTGSVVTLPYSVPSVEVYGQTSWSYTDLKVGDEVSVLLNSSQDQAVNIQIHSAAQFEVVSADVAGSKLRVKKPDSNTVEEWTIPSGVTLQDENGATVTLGQIAPGSVANVTFMGKTPIKIKGVGIQYGKVVSVNMAASTVDIALANGTTVTKQVGTTPVVVRNNATSSTLATVQPDDHVQIRKDANDRTVIEVVPAPLRKQFWFYDATGRALNVLHSGNEQFTYQVDAQVYIHQGTTALTFADLKRDDAISLYMLRDKVVEIAK